MNQFEKEVQSKRNDAIDSGVAFVVSFGFFATLFIIASIVDIFSGF
ncbi:MULTISPECIES: YqzM family protein [Halalkalibacter]|nr:MULTISPECIES: YqzM family protein [Halalkalibacter]MCK0471615.1 YqzM family protein [Halalkalibacter sp. APA_J-10(15)]